MFSCEFWEIFKRNFFIEHLWATASVFSDELPLSAFNHLLQNIEKHEQNKHLEAYSEPCQTSKMGRFAKIVDGPKLLTIFAKHSILIVWQGPEHASDIGMK